MFVYFCVVRRGEGGVESHESCVQGRVKIHVDTDGITIPFNNTNYERNKNLKEYFVLFIYFCHFVCGSCCCVFECV